MSNYKTIHNFKRGMNVIMMAYDYGKKGKIAKIVLVDSSDDTLLVKFVEDDMKLWVNYTDVSIVKNKEVDLYE